MCACSHSTQRLFRRMCAQADAQAGCYMFQFGYVFVTCAKKIFLPKMTEVRACLVCNAWVVVDYKPNIRFTDDGQDSFSHASHGVNRRAFGAQLDDIRTPITELLCDGLGCASMQVGCINKRVEFALLERLHFLQLQDHKCKITNTRR
jgi:hypothetical protein